MKHPNRRFILLAAFVLLLFLAFFLLIRLEDSFLQSDSSSGKTAGEQWEAMHAIEINGEVYLPRQEISTYLMIGLDVLGPRSEQGGSGIQSDVMLLIVADDKAKSFRVIQLDRDTMADIDLLGASGEIISTRYAQLALAHAYGDGLQGSAENTVRAVSRLFYGVNIKSYVSMTMDAVGILNDAIGGVTMTLEDDYIELDPTYLTGSTVTLQGDAALKFVRARSSMADSTNIARMQRQRAYMRAFVSQLTEADTDRLTEQLNAIAPYVVSNVKLNDQSQLLGVLSDYACEEIIVPKGKSVEGDEFMEFYIDEGELRTLVTSLFYRKKS